MVIKEEADVVKNAAVLAAAAAEDTKAMIITTSLSLCERLETAVQERFAG
jgi:hypothetical protein